MAAIQLTSATWFERVYSLFAWKLLFSAACALLCFCVRQIIMIVKKSTRQISVLHVYHHSSIALIWWAIIYHAPGGEAYFSAALNSFVHVVMYWYYLVAALIGKDEKQKRKYLWWGKYLTQMQMTQFAVNMVQAAYDLATYPPYPRFLYTLLFYYMISLLFLFANFYVQKYIVQGQKPQARRKVE